MGRSIHLMVWKMFISILAGRNLVHTAAMGQEKSIHVPSASSAKGMASYIKETNVR